MRTFDIKLSDGKLVRWNGKDGEAASRNYEAEHVGVTVVAWRNVPVPLTVLGRGRIYP